MDSHAFSMGFITNDYQTDINKVCSRPKELLKSCESSLSSWHIQQSALLSSTIIALQICRCLVGTLAPRSLCRASIIHRSTYLWLAPSIEYSSLATSCASVERGQAAVMYDRYNTRNSLLASTALDWTRFSNHQKMVLPCNGLVQGRASIVVMIVFPPELLPQTSGL